MKSDGLTSVDAIEMQSKAEVIKLILAEMLDDGGGCSWEMIMN